MFIHYEGQSKFGLHLALWIHVCPNIALYMRHVGLYLKNKPPHWPSASGVSKGLVKAPASFMNFPFECGRLKLVAPVSTRQIILSSFDIISRESRLPCKAYRGSVGNSGPSTDSRTLCVQQTCGMLHKNLKQIELHVKQAKLVNSSIVCTGTKAKLVVNASLVDRHLL